ncbi:MAG: N-acetylmuramic acid 6-phosphate etherase [Bacteroidota bacterium]
MTNTHLFDQLGKLITEQRNISSMDIDSRSVEEILRIINAEDKQIADVVEREIPYIAKGVEIIVHALRHKGRLIYIGAGTSGRLGVLDAVECPPTFGTSHNIVTGLVAGGEKAMFRAQEGAEDKAENGAKDLEEISLNHKDVVCGIAASRCTPYVNGAIRYARTMGAKTLYVTTNPRSEFDLEVDVAICPEVGPEVIMGSTRMKSGTAQKMVLNMLTTAAMIRLGKVYENMMIDLQMTSRKLTERAKRILMTITDISYEEAGHALEAAGNHVKKAIVMVKAKVPVEEAERRLAAADGFVRAAIENRQYKID